VKLEFEYKNVYYKITFSGRSVIELRGDDIDLLEFCSRLEGKKMVKGMSASEQKKFNSICVVSDFQTSDAEFKEFIYESFRGKDIFKKHKLFVIENANKFVNDEMVKIIKKHPNHYWVLCGFELPYSLISSDAICELRSDDTGTQFWSVFTPEEPPTYREFWCKYSAKNFHLDMGTHNVVLIKGDNVEDKSLLYDALKTNADFVQSWLTWHDDLDGYTMGGVDPIYADVFVTDSAFYYKRDQFKLDEIFEKYKIFVINDADVVVDDYMKKVITSHPDKNWVLIGNSQPDFIPDDAVCVLKKRGKRYWTEFVSETINKEV